MESNEQQAEKLVEQVDLRALKAVHQLKKRLKQLSRNQLINLIFQQMNFAIEQQEANKLLVEQLSRKEDNEKNNNPSPVAE